MKRDLAVSNTALRFFSSGNTITMPTASGAKKRFWIIEDMSPFGKRRKTASSRKMLDEGMMLEGFRRYDLYEDCKDSSWGCDIHLFYLLNDFITTACHFTSDP